MQASRERHVMRMREAIFDELSAAKNHRAKRKVPFLPGKSEATP
jgi:hypothetical protein